MIYVDGLKKTFYGADGNIDAVNGVSFTIDRGEFVAIIGASGSGKSTLMNILGLLDRPTAGTYRLFGSDCGKLSGKRISELRGREIGFVFQNYSLIPRLTAYENVELPLVFRSMSSSARRTAAYEALLRVGLSDRLKHYPSQMSGGQQQRAAIARAVAGGPSLILADEPTGNLDSVSSGQIISLLKELNASGVTVILITHDPGVAANAPRVMQIKSGRLISDIKN